MTHHDPSDDRPRLRLPRLPHGAWVPLAFLAGAAPWVAIAVIYLGLGR